MEAYILTIPGIIVSVLLFVLGYRQTVGARREKIRAANGEIVKTLVRRVVQESYKPLVQDVKRLIEAKAQDYGLRTTELYSEKQILNVVFSRITETDFLSSDKRNEIIELITPVCTQAEAEPLEEKTMAQVASERQSDKVRASFPLLMGIIASIFGTFAVFSYSIIESRELMLSSVFITVAISLAVIIFITFIYRFREPKKEESTASAVRVFMDFEREVRRLLKKTGVKYSRGGLDQDYDFLIGLKGKKILIEVKGWTRRQAVAFMRRLVFRLNNALAAEQADEAIVVTKAPIELYPKVLQGERVKLMTLNELRNYLVHGGLND